MSQKDFSHEELIELLKNGNIPQKQLAAMSLDGVNENESKILISNLTGCDGKIREAVALKINQLLHQDEKYIRIFSKYHMPLANATIDINGNICRLVIDSLNIIKNEKDFADKYLAKIFEYIYESFKGLDGIIFRDKKYTINKQLFKLYWCLESLNLFKNSILAEKLLPVLERAASEKEYTIREKVAQIVSDLDDDIYLPLKTALQNDEIEWNIAYQIPIQP